MFSPTRHHKSSTSVVIASLAVVLLTWPISVHGQSEGLDDVARDAVPVTEITESEVLEETAALTDEELTTEMVEEDGFSLRLNQLRASPGHIELRQSRSRDSVYYSIAPQMKVDRARLHLEFVNSISLVEKRSQLRILNNEAVIAQFPLDPAHPNAAASIDIPINLIEPGFNQIAFEVAQHYTEQCEDFTAPELWTQIDTQLSTLTINGEFDLLAPNLSEIDQLISPTMGGARDFAIINAGQVMTNDALSWGGLISQALALRLKYIMPRLTFEAARPAVSANDSSATSFFSGLDESAVADRNMVLFGTREELAPFVSSDISSAITSAFVGIYPLGNDNRHFAIVIAGTTAEEVQRAALAFSLKSFPFIDDTHMLISEVDIPYAVAQAQTSRLDPDTTYNFSALSFGTKTLSAIGEQTAELTFELPADFYVKESDNFGLALDMSYGAGFRGDSVLNLFINGDFQQAIPLSNEGGAAFRDYKVYIPARTFIPGRNTILFRPAFFSPYGGPCISPGRENLLLTLGGSSELTVPSAERYVYQPDLDIFERTGFPYSSDPSGLDFSMVVADKSEGTITSAYLMTAKLAQVSGGSLYNMWTGFDLKDDMKSRDVILIGPVDSLPSEALIGAPLKLDGEMALPHPGSSGALREIQQADYWSDFTAAYEAARGRSTDVESESVTMIQSGGLGNNALMVAYKSPYDPESTMTVVTASTSEDLEENVNLLVEPQMWGQLAGDLVLWRPNSEFVWAQRAGPIFHVGSINFFELMRYHMARAPWWWILGFGIVIIVMAWTVRAMLKERQRLKETV